jgi:hypothetical protein
MRDIFAANKELAGVFIVDWNQPAPDGRGKLILKDSLLMIFILASFMPF